MIALCFICAVGCVSITADRHGRKSIKSWLEQKNVEWTSIRVFRLKSEGGMQWFPRKRYRNVNWKFVAALLRLRTPDNAPL